MSRRDDDSAPVVRIDLRDEPPVLARGMQVEIEVVERRGPAAVYSELLALTTTGELEKVFAARCLLDLAHEHYRCAREGEATHADTDLWAGIARLLQLATTLLDELRCYAGWPHAPVRSGKLGEQAQVLQRLVASLRETMLNLLRGGVSAAAPVWQVIDTSFADVVQRCDDLAAATSRLIAAYRSEMATPRFLSMDEYLAAQVTGSSFRNHTDYLRAMKLAETMGLDMSRVTLGLYQDLEVVAVVRGVKR